MSDNLVACETAGRIADIPAPVGQIVRAGDPILVVDAGETRVVIDAPVAGRIKRQFYAIDDALPEAAIVALIET